MATISLFGSASKPADNAANAGSGITITPPSSMTAGMLVIVMLQCKQNGLGWSEITITTDGGQQWHEIALDDPTVQFNHATLAISGRMYCCRFNGTWTTNPIFDVLVATAATGTMDVFQIDDPAYEFDLDVMIEAAAFTATTAPSIPAVTTKTNGALVWAYWAVAAANTWSAPAAGFTFLGAANQVRNTSSAQSIARVYQIKTTAGSTGAITATQSASTAGLRGSIAFKAVTTASVTPTTRPTVDMLIDHEASTDGTIITSAILQGCCEPPAASGAWAPSGGTANAVTISVPAELKLSHQRGLQVGTSLQEFNDGNATRGASYSHTLGAETPSFNLDFTIGGTTHTKVSIGFFYRTTYQLAGLASYSSVALFADGTGEFTVWNVVSQFATDYAARLEVNLAPGLVCGAHILPNHTYWITMLMDTTNSVSKLAIFDVDNNWRRHGFTTYLPIVGTSPVNRLQLYCTGGGYVAGTGFSYYDDFALDWTNATFPLLPGVGGSVPPPPGDCPVQSRM
jgi:hypothetical protein